MLQVWCSWRSRMAKEVCHWCSLWKRHGIRPCWANYEKRGGYLYCSVVLEHFSGSTFILFAAHGICSVSKVWGSNLKKFAFFDLFLVYSLIRTSVFYQWRTTFVAEHGLLLMPFSGELWSMTLISAAAILCSITILAATVKSANHGKKRGSVGSMVIDTIGILVCQGKWLASRKHQHDQLIWHLSAGACSRVKQIPLRIVFLTAGLTCSVLYMSYSGAFVASVSTPVKPLTTLRELDRFNFTVFTDPEFIQNYGRGIAKVNDCQSIRSNPKRRKNHCRRLVFRIKRV